MAHHRLKMADQLLDHGEVSATDADAARMFNWASESYSVQSSLWPGQGNHVLAQFNEEAVVVYQAYRPEIAEYAGATCVIRHL